MSMMIGQIGQTGRVKVVKEITLAAKKNILKLKPSWKRMQCFRMLSKLKMNLSSSVQGLPCPLVRNDSSDNEK